MPGWGLIMESKLKHLEFIQAVISRMSTSSFLFKGWAITIAAGLSAFAAADTRAALLVIALISTLMFWGLDGYYLWLERCFIALHQKVSKLNADAIDFSMAIEKVQPLRSWLGTCRRPHLIAFYGMIIVIDIVGIVLIRSK